MTTAPTGLDADFYHFQDLLTPVEQEAALRIRDFMEREVRPIADDYWERAEFPRHLIPGIAATGVDLISIGWITHSAPVLDIGLDFESQG